MKNLDTFQVDEIKFSKTVFYYCIPAVIRYRIDNSFPCV